MTVGRRAHASPGGRFSGDETSATAAARALGAASRAVPVKRPATLTESRRSDERCGEALSRMHMRLWGRGPLRVRIAAGSNRRQLPAVLDQ